jgi:hypothetical protein
MRNTAGTVLGRTNKENYKNWFGAVCQHVATAKHSAYKIMVQRNHTKNATE